MAASPYGLLRRRLDAAGLPVCTLVVRHHLDPIAGVRLRRLVRAGRYHLVHFHTARAHALSPWLQGLGVKRIVTRRMDYAVKKGFLTRLLYVQHVDAVIAISARVRAALVAGQVPITQIRLIPSGIDTSRFAADRNMRAQVRQAYGFAEDEPVVLSVGALVARKGHHTLLQAARHLKEQGLQLHYLICGDGNLRPALEAEVRRLGLDAEVRFTGFCADVPALLAAADVFVHVPLWEGLGVSVIEALAAGLPVIASQVGGIPELIDDQHTGLLVPPQEPTALAVALSRVVQSPLWAGAIGHAGQVRTRAQFDVTAMVRRNEALYHELLGSSG